MALFAYWRVQPPLVTLVSRVCRYFDIKVSTDTPSKPATHSNADMLAELRKAGVPIIEGRPDDPMLDLL